MMKFLNDILLSFRSSFSRNTTFEVFVVIVMGLLLRTDHLGVTSVIRALWLSVDYMKLIGFFRSSAWTLERLTDKWCNLVMQNSPLVRLAGAVVMVGDGVKGSKEGRRMPGVKRLHQESDNSSKAEYIWGHLFGGVGILAERAGKCFCIPLAMRLQDGVKAIFGWKEPEERQGSHVVELIRLAYEKAAHFGKAILLLDRLYLTVPALQMLDSLNQTLGQVLHVIIKAKMNYTAYRQPEPNKRGRPRKRGEQVKLCELFLTAKELFQTADIYLYGKLEHVRYYHIDLLWGQVVFAFTYRFWSKHMPKLNRFKKKTDPDTVEQVTNPRSQKRIQLAVKAIEGFMFCAIVATGLLQMISLRFSGTEELANLRYLRTYRNDVVSEATVADSLRKIFFSLMLRHPDLPITRIISAMQGVVPDASRSGDAA